MAAKELRGFGLFGQDLAVMIVGVYEYMCGDCWSSKGYKK